MLADSLPRSPPFADTIEALRRLSTRFRLAIISNTDDALFAGTQRRLQIRFDHVITASITIMCRPSARVPDGLDQPAQSAGRQRAGPTGDGHT
ncbi:MAG: hypothetical protein C5B50_09310 [Verrucomicrobia bacterium]|nr:MAG: hypothetical protein C5B50_09310 [Verrucomicrobiota bacterium]